MQISDSQFGGYAGDSTSEQGMDNGAVHHGGKDTPVYTIWIAPEYLQRLPCSLGNAIRIDCKTQIEAVRIFCSASEALMMAGDGGMRVSSRRGTEEGKSVFHALSSICSYRNWSIAYDPGWELPGGAG
jgi:hypothetical protein